jgi:hypothetical protein
MELSRHKEIAKERMKQIGAAAFDYDYEAATGLDDKVDLRPGSPFHEKLVDKAIEMAYRSYEGQSTFFENCRKMDWTLTGYVTPEDANPTGDAKNRQRSIVVPMTFEFREYYKAASKGTFIKDPIFKFRPSPGPRALINAAVTEYVLQRQMGWNYGGGSNKLGLMTNWSSCFTYGVGTSGLNWSRKREKRPVNHEVTMNAISMARAMGMNVPDSALGSVLRDMDYHYAYEGTELVPWDVYSTLRDPNTNPNNFQRGEFIGNRRRMSANEVLSAERDPSQRRFNGQYVKALAETGGGACVSTFPNGQTQSGRGDRMQTEVTTQAQLAHGDVFSPVDVLYFEMNIIPKDWECGEEVTPVRYQLEMMGDSIITAFGPLDVMDDEYRVVQTAPNTDGFGFLPISYLFVTSGIQNFVDTMARCIEAMSLKNVNGGWTVFNHNVLNWDDVQNPEPAKLIRYANPFVTPDQAKAALQQFNSNDMRDSHQRQIQEFMGYARSGNGLQDMMSELPERPTELGVRAATVNKVSRIEMINWMIGEQMMTPMGWKMAQNQIQYGKLPVQFEVIGRLAERIQKEIGADPSVVQEVMDYFNADGSVNPLALTMDYEMEAYTGASGQNDDVQAMGSLVQMGMSIPEVAAEMSAGLGWGGIMREYVRKVGFETVSEYLAAGNKMPQMVVGDDAQLQGNIEAGNRVPLAA